MMCSIFNIFIFPFYNEKCMVSIIILQKENRGKLKRILMRKLKVVQML